MNSGKFLDRYRMKFRIFLCCRMMGFEPIGNIAKNWNSETPGGDSKTNSSPRKPSKNLKNILSDLHKEGKTAWEKFNGGKEGKLWYFQEMHALLSKKLPGELANQLGRTIKQIEAITGRE